MKTLQELLHARATGRDFEAMHAVVDAQGGRVRILMAAVGDHARVVLNVDGNDVTILAPSDLYRTPNEQTDAAADAVRRQMTADNTRPGTNLAPNAFARAVIDAAGGPTGQDDHDDDDMLIGSNILPAMVEIADGNSVQLGTIVARAHKDSGLSVAEWNDLAADDREAKLTATVDAMKAEAATPKVVDHTAFSKDALIELAADEKVEGITSTMTKREIADAINKKRSVSLQ